MGYISLGTGSHAAPFAKGKADTGMLRAALIGRAWNALPYVDNITSDRSCSSILLATLWETVLYFLMQPESLKGIRAFMLVCACTHTHTHTHTHPLPGLSISVSAPLSQL